MIIRHFSHRIRMTLSDCACPCHLLHLSFNNILHCIVIYVSVIFCLSEILVAGVTHKTDFVVVLIKGYFHFRCYYRF